MGWVLFHDHGAYILRGYIWLAEKQVMKTPKNYQTNEKK